MNTETFKKPQTWAVIVPCVLLLWAIVAMAQMLSMQEQARKRLDTAREARRNADRIVEIETKLGKVATGEAASRTFNGIDSAVRCAFTAGVPVSKVIRVDVARPQRQKDGSLLNHETYKIKGVDLVRIIKFVHAAERNYPALNCTELIITRARSNVRDFWDATADLKYLTEYE